MKDSGVLFFFSPISSSFLLCWTLPSSKQTGCCNWTILSSTPVTQAECSFNPDWKNHLCKCPHLHIYGAKRDYSSHLYASHDEEVCEGPLLNSAQMKGYFGQARSLSLIQFSLDSFAQVLCTIFRHCWLRLSFFSFQQNKNRAIFMHHLGPS